LAAKRQAPAGHAQQLSCAECNCIGIVARSEASVPFIIGMV
jgi:hypothetical protein